MKYYSIRKRKEGRKKKKKSQGKKTTLQNIAVEANVDMDLKSTYVWSNEEELGAVDILKSWCDDGWTKKTRQANKIHNGEANGK